jgi:hypothetical protein
MKSGHAILFLFMSACAAGVSAEPSNASLQLSSAGRESCKASGEKILARASSPLPEINVDIHASWREVFNQCVLEAGLQVTNKSSSRVKVDLIGCSADGELLKASSRSALLKPGRRKNLYGGSTAGLSRPQRVECRYTVSPAR